MHVHARAVDAPDGLGHERRIHPVLTGNGLEHVLERHRRVSRG